MNILIVKLSAIGDVIHTLPALTALRRRYPDAHIAWLVEEAAADLVIGHRAVDRVLVSRRKRWLRELRGPGKAKSLREIRDFLCALRDTRYDLILDFQALLKSAVLIAMARGRRKVGFGPGLEHMEHSYRFLNERVPAVDMEIHALDRGLMLLEALGIPRGPVTYDLPVGEDEWRAVDALLRRRGVDPVGPLVAVNPVAKWETKLWSPAAFARLADCLADRCGAQVVFTGSAQDRPVIADIRSRMAFPAADLAGETSLKTLAALYRRCRLLVSTDTGPMHLACAVDTPVVALFGPTAPWRTGPYGPRHRVVRAGIACSPCFKRTCPLHTGDCMRQIPVPRVFAAAESFFAASTATPREKPAQDAR